MAGSSRLSGLDRLRGAALIAMALYHTTWDLHDQGLLSLDPVSHPAFMWSARIIAATFLMLSGVSLTLAHPERINWQKFWRREAQLLVAALAVSVGSYMLFPQSWIAFGILHHLAAGSLLASLLLYRSTPVLLGLALLCLFLPQLATHEAMDGRWLEWIGLSAHVSPANDYVPLLPWFAFVLIGVLAGRVLVGRQPHSATEAGKPAQALEFLGRHGLLFYLIHQPVLIGLISGLVALGALEPVHTTPQNFMGACARDCAIENPDAKACKRMCSCLYQELKDLPMMSRQSNGVLSVEEENRIRAGVAICR